MKKYFLLSLSKLGVLVAVFVLITDFLVSFLEVVFEFHALRWFNWLLLLLFILKVYRFDLNISFCTVDYIIDIFKMCQITIICLLELVIRRIVYQISEFSSVQVWIELYVLSKPCFEPSGAKDASEVTIEFTINFFTEKVDLVVNLLQFFWFFNHITFSFAVLLFNHVAFSFKSA